jgi:MFS family permease
MKRLALPEFLIYLGNGLFTPAWYILLYERGGDISQFGILMGLLAVGSALAALFSGFLSHYRPYLVLAVAALLQGVVMVLYIPDLPIWCLYVLQLGYGIVSTALITTEQVCISRLSEGDGKKIGGYSFFMHGTLAFAMILSGVTASMFGVHTIIGLSATILVSGSALAFLNHALYPEIRRS